MRRLHGLLVNDASLAGHHGSAVVTDRAVALAREAGIDLTAGWDWPAAEAALAGDHSFDLVVVNGEGSIHHDSKAARRIATLAHKLAARNCPAYLINASEEANGPEVLAGLAQFRLRFMRDRASRDSLARRDITASIVPDLTLSWDDAPLAQRRGALLVTDSSSVATTERLLALARRWSGARPVSLRARPPWPARGSKTRALSFPIKRLAGGLLPLSPWSLRHGQVLQTRADFMHVLAAEASAIVCGRYHGVCLALRTGLPFLAVEGNIGKIGALLGRHRHRRPDCRA